MSIIQDQLTNANKEAIYINNKVLAEITQEAIGQDFRSILDIETSDGLSEENRIGLFGEVLDCVTDAKRAVTSGVSMLSQIHADSAKPDYFTNLEDASKVGMPMLAFANAMSTAQSIVARGIRAAKKLLTKAMGGAKAAGAKLKNSSMTIKLLKKAKKLLKDLGKWVLQVISTLVTPKKWVFTGKLGTGPFGIAEAGIEVEFG